MKKIKIDVVAVPLSGHLFPALNLVLPLLKNPAYDIRVFTGPQRQKVAEDLGFKVIPVLENQVEHFERVANNERRLTIFDAYKQLASSIDLTDSLSDQLEKEWTKERPDIIIADFITLSAGLVADKLNIPWITTMATQFAIETNDGPPCFFGGLGSPKSNAQKCYYYIGRKLMCLIKSSAVFLLRKRLCRYNFKLYRKDKSETIYSPYSILGIGMKEAELKSGFPGHFVWAGPSGYALDKAEEYPLDLEPFKDKKKVLVTCGTQLPWAKQNLIDQTLKLAKSHKDYHFFITLGSSKDGFTHSKLASNVSVVSYLPYQSYLSQMDYVIHHGGAGIFYQCIVYSKPALILPHDYDQFDFAVRGVEANIATSAKRDDSTDIDLAFKELISKEWPELHRLQAIAQDYRPTERLESEIHRILATKETIE